MPLSRGVAVFTESVSRGGAEVSLRNLLAALDPVLDVTLIGVHKGICSWIAAARPGTEVVVVRPPRGKFALRASFSLRRELARRRPCVFHVNLRTIEDAQYAIVAALTVPDVKVIAVEQLPYPPDSRLSIWLKRLTSPRLAAHVAVGERAARIVEETVGLAPNSIVTIYNGVPDLGPAAVRPATGDVVIGTLARLDRIKGLDLLLDAAAALSNTHFMLIGEGADADLLADQAERLGISDRVRFVPWTDDAHKLFDQFDIFVLPSRNEGFPLSIVEAMLAARPVVAADVGSVREAIAEGETGFVVPPDDVQALRAALERLIADPDLRRRFGTAGRARALELFTAERMAGSFERLYEQVGV